MSLRTLVEERPNVRRIVGHIDGETRIHAASKLVRDRLHAAGFREIGVNERIADTLDEAEAFFIDKGTD